MPKMNLVQPSYTAYSLAVAAQQSLNCYLETIEAQEAKNKYVLRGRPGMTLLKDLTTIDAAATPVRGLWSCAGPAAGTGRLFVAAGTKFFELDSTFNLVGSISTIANDAGAVDILANRNQLFVVSAGNSYYTNGATLNLNSLPSLSGTCDTNGTLITLSPTNTGDSFDVGMIGQTVTINGVTYTVTAVVNPNQIIVGGFGAGVQTGVAWSCTPILNAVRGAFLDGYYIVNRLRSWQFNISALYDGSSWSGLDFDVKSGYPDNIAAVWTEPPYLYLLGTETSEVWQDTGAASFPFERVTGGFVRIGCASPWSCVSIMGRLHMLASNNQGQVCAVRMEGTTPVRISTHAVEYALRNMIWGDTNGVSFAYFEQGHWFWVIATGLGNAWVYDFTESQIHGSPQWHERAQWDGAAFQNYIPWYHAFVPQWDATHVVGGINDGKLYSLNSDYFADNGADVRYVRALPYVYQDNKIIRHDRIEFVMETGTVNPPMTVLLDWSDDNGQTWGTGAGTGTTLNLGPGVHLDYTTRYFASALGSSRGRVYRITVTGQGRLALIDAVLEYEVLGV